MYQATALRRLGQVICKNLCFLYQDEEAKQVFSPAPFVLFRSVRTRRSHLVRAKIYPVKERLVGSRKCNKNRCQVCKNVIETETFQSFVDQKIYKINLDLDVVTNVWSTSCLVKLAMNSDTTSKQQTIAVLLMTLK